MEYYLYVGAGIPVGGYVSLHIIYQEMLNANSTNLPALFYSPPVGTTIFTFSLL